MREKRQEKTILPSSELGPACQLLSLSVSSRRRRAAVFPCRRPAPHAPALPPRASASPHRRLLIFTAGLLLLPPSAEGSNSVGTDGKMLVPKEASSSRSGGDPWKVDFSSGEKPATPLLDTVSHPIHMKNLSTPELEQLAAELRTEVVHTVSKTGGHLSSSLGVIELVVALHHVFDTPDDKMIWDVGHQAYPHKILTGRRSRMHTLWQTSGLAGFPKCGESPHDACGAGHSSTSISAALGMAVACNLLGRTNHVVSVIGDGAMTSTGARGGGKGRPRRGGVERRQRGRSRRSAMRREVERG